MADVAALEATLYDVSTPGSSRYHKWFTREQADDLTRTPADIVKKATTWATSTGARCAPLTNALKCEGSVAQIEALLDAELSYFVAPATGQKLIRTSMHKPGGVPAELEGVVSLVTGLTQLPMGQRTGTTRPVAAYRAQSGDTDYAIVPETLLKLYNVDSSDSTSATSAGPIEFQVSAPVWRVGVRRGMWCDV